MEIVFVLGAVAVAGGVVVLAKLAYNAGFDAGWDSAQAVRDQCRRDYRERAGGRPQ